MALLISILHYVHSVKLTACEVITLYSLHKTRYFTAENVVNDVHRGNRETEDIGSIEQTLLSIIV